MNELQPTRGSVLNMTPAAPGTKIRVTTPGQEDLTLMIVAWATVVSWINDGDEDTPGDYETDIEPVVIAEDYIPTTFASLRLDWNEEARLNSKYRIEVPE